MPDTVELFDVAFTNAARDEVFACISQRIERREPAYIITPNVDHVCRYHRDETFRAAYADAFMALPDGTPIIWASVLLGSPLREKLSGSDLVPLLSELAAERGYSVFYFGAAKGIAEEAAARLTARFPALRVVGAYGPPYGFEKDPEQNAEAIRRLREAQPDLCFFALGSPKQEFWMHRHYLEYGAGVSLGIGAGLDFAAGRLKRAPAWVQNLGLEWVWRLCLEPRRLWRRYLVDDMLFFVLFWREFRKRFRR